MRTLAISDFKAHALRILGQVAETKESVVVTKRGKPLAEVVPISTDKPGPGKLSEALVFEKNIVSSLGEDIWDACK